jgi:flavin-dependent dehydrogenase
VPPARLRWHRYVVDATGRNALIGRRLGARRVIVDCLFSLSTATNGSGLVGAWTESTANGWWNLISDQRNGTLSFFSTAAVIRKSRGQLVEAFQETRHLKLLLDRLEPITATVRQCGSSILCPCAGPGWAAVGDAAATLQPLASAGIAKALLDASIVPTCFRRGHDERYRAVQGQQFRAYRGLLIEQYRREIRVDAIAHVLPPSVARGFEILTPRSPMETCSTIRFSLCPV